MKHRSHKELISKTASDLSLPEEMVSDLVEAYWKAFKIEMRTFKYPRLKIINLGDFHISPRGLAKNIKVLTSWKESSNVPKTFGRMVRYQEGQEKLKLLLELSKKLEEEDKKFQLKLKKRYGEQYNKNLEKQR